MSPSTTTAGSGRLALASAVLSLGFAGVMFSDLARWVVAYGNRTGVEDALFEPASSSPILIFGVFGLLMYGRRSGIRRFVVAGRGRIGLALPFLGLAIALASWSTHVGEPALLVPAFASFLLGLAAVLGGAPFVRYILLPACFTLLAVPLPAFVVNLVIYPLQLATAHASYHVLDVLGAEPAILGVRFHALGRTFQVIESCAGLRSILTALMASIVYADLMVPDRRRVCLLVPTGMAIAFAMNILRVIVIVSIPSQELADDHSAQGIVAIVATVLLLAGVDRLTAPLFGDPPQSSPYPDRIGAGSGASGPVRWLAVVATSALGAIAVLVTPVWDEPGMRSYPYVSLPYTIDGWTASNLKVDREFLGTVDFDERIYRRYEQGGLAMDLFVAIDQRLDPRRSLLSPKTALLGSAVRVDARAPLPATSMHPAGEELRVSTLDGPMLMWTWVEGHAGFWEELVRSLLVLDRGVWRRSEDVIVVHVATPMGPSVEATRRRIEEFLAAALPALEIAPLPSTAADARPASSGPDP
jgi:exosortase